MGVEERLFKHYKGGFYLMVGKATHTETKEKLVVYKALKDGKLYVIPESMFFGTVSYNGFRRNRFDEINDDTFPIIDIK